jgi:hypothetical protein
VWRLTMSLWVSEVPRSIVPAVEGVLKVTAYLRKERTASPLHHRLRRCQCGRRPPPIVSPRVRAPERCPNVNSALSPFSADAERSFHYSVSPVSHSYYGKDLWLGPGTSSRPRV